MEIATFILTIITVIFGIPQGVLAFHHLRERKNGRAEEMNPTSLHLPVTYDKNPKFNIWEKLRRLRPMFTIAFIICGSSAVIMAAAQIRHYPRFNCELPVGLIGYMQGPDGKFMTSVTFLARVVNNGDPSALSDWKVIARIPTGEEIEAIADPKIIREINPDMNAEIDPLGNFQHLTMDNLLPYSLSENPVPRGAARGGWMVFTFDKSMFDELHRPGVVFTVYFRDVTGKQYQSVFKNGLKSESSVIGKRP